MKPAKYIFFGLIALTLSAAFESDSPPGWFQQVLPVNDQINDIYFLDSLTGWVCTAGATSGSDTGYVMKTTNGGNNWAVQFKQIVNLNVIQFTDANTGYTGGGDGLAKIYKTTNSGLNWSLQSSLGFITVQDLFFVNNDTGWVCDPNPLNGRISKTTNGGLNWQTQLGATFNIKKLFFISNDTGWAISNEANSRLYRTTTNGQIWNLLYTFSSNPVSFYFIDSLNGWVGGAGTGNGIQYTTNGGFNWINSQGFTGGGYDIKFANDSIGYTGRVPDVLKSTDGGKNWGYQVTPPNSYRSIATIKNDALNVWAGTFSIIHTIDGGGPITYIGISPNSTLIPSFNLRQNYPNPYNPVTNITFDIRRNSKVSLKIFDMLGEEIDELIDYEKHSTGTYTVSYEADDDLASGVYFYQMTAWTEDKKEIFIDTKKMLLIK